MIIDFHTHTFPEAICDRAIEKLSTVSATKAFTNGSLSELLTSMRAAKVDYSVTLPVMTNPAQVEKVNHSLFAQKEELIKQGIIPFGGMHPDYEDYKEELKRIKEAGLPGIKIHPAYQNVDLNDPRVMRIIAACSELDLIVLTHAGIDIGIYDHNYASVDHILQILKEVAPTKFVLAHFGNWACWDAVESDLAGAPVYLDTAFSIGDITPRPNSETPPIRTTNLTPEDFARIAKKHGIDKVLFATDSPWEDQAQYIRRIHALPLSEAEKEMILGKNAQNLLQL